MDFLRSHRMFLGVSTGLSILGAIGLGIWLFFVRPVVVRVPDRLPADFPAAGFDHGELERLLQRFVGADGTVHYAKWHADEAALAALDAYLAAVARFSPENAPERFPEEADRLVYWMNAYNACVLKGILVHWPIGGVHEVRAPLELKAGLAFFWRLQFVFGGEVINLYNLEHEVIRGQFKDPRIHFVLNCGSEGCPILSPELPEGAELESTLAQATQRFLGDPRNVAIDHEQRRLTLSSIFDWYRDDFVADLTRRGLPPSERSLLTWIRGNAEEPLRTELERAADYAVEFAEYSWELNGE